VSGPISVDGSSGSRQDVVVSGPDSNTADAGSPAVATGVGQHLLEKSRYGMIPVVAADGLKPFKAYAMGTEADRAKAAKTPG